MIRDWIRRHRQAATTATGGALVLALLTGFALVSDGYDAQRVDLDDGSVWVVNSAQQADRPRQHRRARARQRGRLPQRGHRRAAGRDPPCCSPTAAPPGSTWSTTRRARWSTRRRCRRAPR
ncbi:hypothetical protein [Clavibacter zhangzhiyongii]|uniref:hypothetical protein n=1 Tax=Clavibacter zhangzhiyongii TaxID=2768071 RepID=UPI0039E00AF2